jgi:cellulose synthase/poly-beta-1,6-N-acetylglucosamine synthase-like glycosyltransferase
MMPVKNESDRYLERVLENTLTFAEEIAILDDHSDPDQYAKLLDIQNKLGCDKIHVAQATATWDNESELRAELLRFALTRSPDWLIAVDADELYEPDMAGVVKEYMTQQSIDVVAFRFYDMWNDECHYRDDDFFSSGNRICPPYV